MVLYARNSLLQSAIGVYVRNIVVHKHAHTDSFSMPFALLAFPELPSSQQEQWAVDFFDSPECCLDNFALSVKKLVGEPLALCSPDVQAALRHAAHSCIHTQFVESRHGRTRNYRAARSQIRCLRHQTSQYVIRESQRIHREDVRAKLGRQPRKRKKKRTKKKTTKKTTKETKQKTKQKTTKQKTKRDKRGMYKKAATKGTKLSAKLAYINQQGSFHKLDHGRASKQAYFALRKFWSAEFDRLAPEEKDVFQSLARRAADVEPSTDLVPASQIHLGHLASGTIDNIIHPSLVEDVLAQFGGGCLRTVAGVAYPESELVLDPCFSTLPAVPKTELGSHQSCGQRHYGLCIHRDAAILAKARSIHAWLKHISDLAKAHRQIKLKGTYPKAKIRIGIK